MPNLLVGLTFLVIGDSHMAHEHYLISTLHDELMSQGAKVYSYGECGVSPGAWAVPKPMPCGIAERELGGPVKQDEAKTAKGWQYDALVAQIKPNAVIVEIGDPMAAYNLKELPRAAIAESVAQLTARIKASNLPCIWVGPGWGTEGGPYFKTFARVKELSDFIKPLVAPCQYVDSLTLSKQGEWPTFDGQHYNSVGYKKWGAALAQVIEQNATIHALVKK